MDVGVRCIISLWKVASFRNREVIRYLFQKNEPRLSVVGVFIYYCEVVIFSDNIFSSIFADNNKKECMDEFYTELKKLVPLKYNKGDFRDVLVGALESYVDLLELHKKELCPDIDDVISYVKLCNIKIETCIEAYFEGMYSVAYQCIEEILSDVLYSDGYLTILPDSLFYRARVFKTNGRKSYTEMFHIPLDKRGIVETQRYSAPGYPCLYLGSSINACWEELRKPRFDDMMVSLFVVNEKFPVLDLRIPKKKI